MVLVIWLACGSGAEPIAARPVPTRLPAPPGWLEGTWTSTAPDGTVTRETWVSAGDGLSGESRTTRADGTEAESEVLRIESKDGLTYVAAPSGQRETRFVARQASAQDLVFENAAHDFPQRIAYHRDGSVLTATVSTLDGKRSLSWTFSGP